MVQWNQWACPNSQNQVKQEPWNRIPLACKPAVSTDLGAVIGFEGVVPLECAWQKLFLSWWPSMMEIIFMFLEFKFIYPNQSQEVCLCQFIVFNMSESINECFPKKQVEWSIYLLDNDKYQHSFSLSGCTPKVLMDSHVACNEQGFWSSLSLAPPIQKKWNPWFRKKLKDTIQKNHLFTLTPLLWCYTINSDSVVVVLSDSDSVKCGIISISQPSERSYERSRNTRKQAAWASSW